MDDSFTGLFKLNIMNILSTITEGGTHAPRLKGTLSLHPDQLVINALEILLDHDLESLPVCKNDHCVGIVYIKDLIWFLTTGNKKHDLLFHKFNFDLHTAVKKMKQMR
ncbi:CBS domain protein [Pedobacter nutrimenti]|jgi:CBS domain-containing protein|uniref:CBS domain protein n=2 Tax=Pedobacter nutrimenti TaxID=1241337 RepID=A0A318ULH0_9SPHI|nr:CBS domain protein [Pedobacter nutrimenti]